MFTAIDTVLNEYDLFALDNKLTWGNDCAHDLRVLNAYLEDGAALGAHWGSKRAIAVRADSDGELLVQWSC